MRLSCWQFFLPESPRWLLLAGKPEKAKLALAWARGKYGKDKIMVDAEYNDMVMMSTGLDEVRGEFFLFAEEKCCAGHLEMLLICPEHSLP